MQGRFHETSVVDPKGRGLRHVLKERSRLARTQRRVMCSLQSLAKSHRLAMGPRLFTRAGRRKFLDLPMQPQVRETGLELWELLDWLAPRVRRLDTRIELAVRKCPDAVLLATYPWVEAATALATVLTSGRATSSFRLGGPARGGGNPRCAGSIPSRRSKFLRSLTVEAIDPAARHEPFLRRFYRRILARRGVRVAKTATARKLIVHLSAMLRDGIDYTEFARRRFARRGATEKPRSANGGPLE